jgi:hypothetical protein
MDGGARIRIHSPAAPTGMSPGALSARRLRFLSQHNATAPARRHEMSAVPVLSAIRSVRLRGILASPSRARAIV